MKGDALCRFADSPGAIRVCTGWPLDAFAASTVCEANGSKDSISDQIGKSAQRPAALPELDGAGKESAVALDPPRLAPRPFAVDTQDEVKMIREHGVGVVLGI
jgi:hypothetical protein